MLELEHQRKCIEQLCVKILREGDNDAVDQPVHVICGMSSLPADRDVVLRAPQRATTKGCAMKRPDPDQTADPREEQDRLWLLLVQAAKN